uniref:Dihydroorotate dehydrogenase (quinone), mitochondrial n=1 Tax=Globisporangium ultimum (strain ATCC 200006 / CBS 805.95 / DAOM BR144) TaxID=431595 RepID=K3WLG9_GLOUD
MHVLRTLRHSQRQATLASSALTAKRSADVARFSTQSSSPKSSSGGFRFAEMVALAGGIGAAGVAISQGFVPHEWVIRQLSEPVLMPLVRLFDPETAHVIAVKSAALGLIPRDHGTDSLVLSVKAFGQEFPNPLGMAAGFDKNAEAIEGLLDIGFGFVEIGSVTPKPQPGNPKPRVFRLTEDRGVINRYGFNSSGMDAVAKSLESYVTTRELSKRFHRSGVLGVNLGKNKTTEDAAADYVEGVYTLGKYADYLVVNVSSPNTPGLRSLQGKQQLQELLTRVLDARKNVEAKENRKIPLLVKIAPDLTEDDKKDIADVAVELNLDGLIVSNTTLSRPDTLKSSHKIETGGLSGAPVRDLSTQVLSDMYKLTNGMIPLIGVGGVSSGKDAYEKICAGATLVQMYSCMVYDGPTAVPRAKQELEALLLADGYKNVVDAIGAAHKK